MTPFVPFPDGAQVYLRYDLYGNDCSNRLWFLNRQPPNTTDQIDNLAAGVAGWCVDWLLPFLSVELELVRVDAADWNSDPSPYISSFPVAVFGGSSATSHSANVAARVCFQGANNQTWPNNSHFVPGIPLDVVSGNDMSPTFQDNVFEAYVKLIDLANVFGPFPAWQWQTASSWLNGSLRSELAIARTDFIKFSNPYSTQRRRRIPR